MVRKHGEKWILVPGPIPEQPTKFWYYLKQFQHINPEEWNEMIRARELQVSDRDERSIATMGVLDRDAQRLSPQRYARNVEFLSLF
jgi:hypothetical protein